MGNYLEAGSHTFDEDAENIRPDIDGVGIDMPQQDNLMSTSTSSIEVATEAGESLDFHIFSYKQHMSCKKRQFVRWATAKLALTEELIRNNQICNAQNAYLEPETDYLSDDEMEEVPLHQQLHSLESYRTELVELLGRLSLDQRPKSKKKKSKKSKRRKFSNSKESNRRTENQRDINTDMWGTSKDAASINVCSDQITKREPFKVKNC